MHEVMHAPADAPPPRERIMVRLSAPLLERLTVVARGWGVSRTSVLERALAAFLDVALPNPDGEPTPVALRAYTWPGREALVRQVAPRQEVVAAPGMRQTVEPSTEEPACDRHPHGETALDGTRLLCLTCKPPRVLAYLSIEPR